MILIMDNKYNSSKTQLKLCATSSKNEYIDDPSILNFVSEINNDIIRTPALYLIKKNNRKISLIEDFSVLPSSERKGVEKLIIEYLIKFTIILMA